MLDELSIINSMLASTGVGSLTSTDSQHPDYQRARIKLDEVLVSVLKIGHWYNTSYPTLSVNTIGEIVLPSGTLHCDPLDTSLNYVKRGARMFDLGNRTFKFPSGTRVRIKHITSLKIEELPATAQDYLKARARYEYYLDEDGDENKLRRYDDLKSQAWAELYREHLRCLDVNATHSPSATQMRKGTRPRGHSTITYPTR